MVEMIEKKQKENKLKNISKTTSELITAPRVVGSNVSAMQRTPMTILSKEQAMLQALFGQKHQLWGGNNPVQINNTLTSGNGLIKTGSGNATRRLMF